MKKETKYEDKNKRKYLILLEWSSKHFVIISALGLGTTERLTPVDTKQKQERWVKVKKKERNIRTYLWQQKN
jgi:hypothetical protein